MKKTLEIAAVIPRAVRVGAAKLPTNELRGFPISAQQLLVVEGRSPVPTVSLGRMPASPHQIAILMRHPTAARLT